MTEWKDKSRRALTALSAASSLSFTAAKYGTKFGFFAARGITSTALNVATLPLDFLLFGGVGRGTGAALGTAASTVLNGVEHLVLAPILIGESIASTSIVAAQSSLDRLGGLDVLSTFYPGSDEASFSLASFLALVRREWNEPVFSDQLPKSMKEFSVAEVSKGLIAWGALQSVTREWQEDKWFKVLREIPVDDSESESTDDLHDEEDQEHGGPDVHVMGSQTLPEHDGKLLTADIGEVSLSLSVSSASSDTGSDTFLSARSTSPQPTSRDPSPSQNYAKLKATLRRYSKMVLAGYGGAGLIFFGVALTPTDPPQGHAASQSQAESGANTNTNDEESDTLTHAVESSEREAHSHSPRTPMPDPLKPYSWWNVLLGKHDKEIFESFAITHSPVTERATVGTGADVGNTETDTGTETETGNTAAPRPSTAIVGAEGQLPRYWVLTDHGRKQVVLVLRGTMTLTELAVDLTCEPTLFTPADSSSGSETEGEEQQSQPRTAPVQYEVHGGMLKMALLMGEKGKPVYNAVRDALRRNRRYELVLCGHSFGAGVVAILGLKWADPNTCFTVRSSGLPVGRRVSVYCFAPPCLTSSTLGALSTNLITSFVYSFDIVSRLSLGSVRDMARSAVWLCDGEKRGQQDEGYVAVTTRALKWTTGFGSVDDPIWFLAMRKTLEANMHTTHLYPPGRVLWALREGDFCQSHRLASSTSTNKLRLFEVLDVEKAFSQIVFGRNMLSSHLPHQYDHALHELL